MKTLKIKKHGQRLLQVRCENASAVNQALKTYGNYLFSRDGIKEEKFLYFAI